MKAITIFFLSASLLFTGCGDDKPAVSISWVFDTREDANGIPQTDIKIEIDGGSAVSVQRGVGDFSAVDKADYARHAVPANALTACAGFWAGYHHVIYVVKEGDSLVIMDGGQDEGQEGFAFRELKRIPVQ